MPEVSGRIIGSKAVAFSTDKCIFGESKNKSGKILGSNIKIMSTRSAKTLVHLMRYLSILTFTRVLSLSDRRL